MRLTKKPLGHLSRAAEVAAVVEVVAGAPGFAAAGSAKSSAPEVVGVAAPAPTVVVEARKPGGLVWVASWCMTAPQAPVATMNTSRPLRRHEARATVVVPLRADRTTDRVQQVVEP
jgi:hypothetical protein